MELKSVIAKNIIQLRQSAGMTQLDLAEKMNYSDKAVSKWERGESMPDITVLKEMADLFGVTLDWLVTEEHTSAPVNVEDEAAKEKRILRNRFAVMGMSIFLVWLIATALFVILQAVPAITTLHWLAFVYALPCSAVVWLIFNCVWFPSKWNYPIVSFLMWSVIGALYVNLSLCGLPMWQLFLVGIPGQIIIIMWSALRFNKK